ncbi:cytochrome P450 81E8-like [Senna tora]|uniref:Cytochrome P450 81E8-like n=1 Tax=Senna tora TaxID=362788 RepID=A0A834WMC1_9FABA|nr:cytochrome P450 81E8-like [Senna tora]
MAHSIDTCPLIALSTFGDFIQLPVFEPQASTMADESSSTVDSLSTSVPKLYLQSAPATTIKLTETNFLIWQLQIIATINGYRLEKFLTGEHPKMYLTRDDEKAGKINKEYLHWRKQDQLLASWLIASMAEEMVTRMVGKSTSQQIWDRLTTFFSGHTVAKERLLKTQLRSIKKGAKSISEFLLAIKKVVDELNSLGASISDHEHMECIFYGLPKDYESFVTNVSLRKDTYSVTEVEALLLTQETRIEKFKESVEPVSANLAQTQTSSKGQNQNGRSQNMQFNPRNFNSNRGGYRGPFNNNSNNFNNFNNNRGRGRGRMPNNNNNNSWPSSRPQCQVCGRQGHLAVNCYHRYDQNYTESTLYQALQSQQFRPSTSTSTPMEAMIATPETLRFKLETKEVLLKGRVKDGLYCFDNLQLQHIAKPVTSATYSALTAHSNSANNFDLWHSRLGHCSSHINTISSSLSPTPTFSTTLPHIPLADTSLPNPLPMSSLHHVSPTTPMPNPSTSTTPMLPISSINDTPPNEMSPSLATSPALPENPMPTLPENHGPPATSTATSNNDPPNVPTPPTNVHPMLTRAKAGVFKPKAFLTSTEPSTVKDALASPIWKAEVTYLTDGSLLLSQTKYLKDLLLKVGMSSSKSVQTPMISGQRLSKEGSEPMPNPQLYRTIVGSLQYATSTRPELAFAVNKVSQFMHSPQQTHWQAVKRILRYLAGTLDFGIHLQKSKNIPPGPPYLPIIGNLHQLKDPLHRTLQTFSQRYGQIFSLRFASRLVVVVTSSSAVQECFNKNDIVLVGKYLGYNYTTILFSPYGDHWRNLRRITALEVLSTHPINNFAEMRKDEIKRMVQKLGQASYKGLAKVEMKSRLTEMTFNTIMRMIAGKRYWGEDCEVGDVEEARNFREMILEMVALGGANNPGDFLPVLNWIDFDGFEKKLKNFYKRADAFLQGLIDEHRNGNEGANTMIAHLLSLRESQPQYYTDEIIKGIILVMLIAGTDTSALTLEWAMSSLLNQPEVLKKVKEEIDNYIGSKERLIDEADVLKLPYLQNIISETLRLYPAAPLLLVPHFSSDNCSISGYDVPRDTMVLVNAWAIHRDPQLWSDPLSFKLERFDKEGETNKLIAFGLGRRACPGAGLAQRTVGLTLVLLIQCFEWKRVSEEQIDMTERVGITLQKMIPLEAMCKVRHSIINKIIFEDDVHN